MLRYASERYRTGWASWGMTGTLSIVVLAVCGLWGCGGGGGSDNGGVGGMLTDEERAEAMDAVDAKWATLPGTDLEADAKALAEFMEGMPEFEASGVSANDGTAWGRFRDGRCLLLLNPPEGSDGDANAWSATQGLRPRDEWRRATPGRVTSAAASDLPTNGNCAFFNWFPATHVGLLHLVEAALYAGYWPQLPISAASEFFDVRATLSAIRALQGQTLGLFYWLGHGGETESLGGIRSYSLLTSDQVPPTETDPAVLVDLAAGRLNYGMVRGGWHYYAINERFVGNYIALGGNSLAFVNACSSWQMSSAFSSSGAANYVGWTKPAQTDTILKAEQYLLRRLLGNTDNITEPARFLSTAWSEAEASGVTWSYATKGLSYLRNQRLAGNLKLLRPGITSAVVTTNDDEEGRITLTLEGSFGEEEGDVWFPNITNISRWNATEIVCELSAAPDATSELSVTVYVGPYVSGAFSNVEFREEPIGP